MRRVDILNAPDHAGAHRAALDHFIRRQAIIICSAFVVVLAGLSSFSPPIVQAQGSGLHVTITRPGEGETLYSSPSAPFAAVPVMGAVTTDEFQVKQLQVRLEVFQGDKITGSQTTTPLADGSYSFDVGISPNPFLDIAELEQGCKSNCHSMQELRLPGGRVLLRVTVLDPLGRKASADRSVTVDNSIGVVVPVQVTLEDEASRSVQGLEVVGVTRLYQWRAREYSAQTNGLGRAEVHLEALAQSPTRYLFRVKPKVIEGIMYSSEPVTVTLSPGAATIPAVNLIAKAQRGQIVGIVDSKGVPPSASEVTVRAIELPSGVSHIARTTAGKFTLADLPLAKYLLTIDETEAAAVGLRAEPQRIDLSETLVVSTTLKVAPSPPRTVRGVVRDANGNSLPLAWATTDDKTLTSRVSPASGEFVIHGLADGVRAVWVTAPGYWSRPLGVSLNGLFGISQPVDLVLTPLPETRSIRWGTGTITLPSNGIMNLSGSHLTLQRGWVWGKGEGEFFISTPDAEMTLRQGSFALEYLPGECRDGACSTPALYVMEGEVQVTCADQVITVSGGHMLNFGNRVETWRATSLHGCPSPVALDGAVIRALHTGEPIPVVVETDPALFSRIRDGLEGLGLSFAQAIGVFVLLVGVAILGGLFSRNRHRRPMRRL